MKISAFFFDMGGTIETYGYTPELRLAATPELAQKLAVAGLPLNLSTPALYRLAVDGIQSYHQWRMQSGTELSAGHIWRDFVLAAFPQGQSLSDWEAEDLMEWYELKYHTRQMRPEIPQVLGALRERGLKLGVISNTASLWSVPHQLETYGLSAYFDFVLTSAGYGKRKPGADIFYEAARLAQVPPGACGYVGDRISRDVLGARQAGYALAVQIRHDLNHHELEEGALPDALIEDMRELLPLIDGVKDV